MVPVHKLEQKQYPLYRSALILFYIASINLLDVANGASSIRGVGPSSASKYKPDSGAFACFDGSGSFAFERVNDNFCDCVDGSDEPGTSACPLGHFYCRNRGHQPLLLNSSSVDDGFCDCCDGTDESSGICPNTCAEAGATNRAALKAKADAFKTGLKSKERYLSQAVTTRQKWEQDVLRLNQEEVELKKTVNRLQGKKDRIEKQEAKEQAAEQAAKIKQLKEEAAQRAAEAGVEPSEDAVAPETETPSGEEVAAAPTEQSPVDLEQPVGNHPEGQQQVAEPEGNGEKEDEELSEEEKGRRIAAQWTHDPEATGQVPTEDTSEGKEAAEVELPSVPKYEPPNLIAEQPAASEEQVQEADEEDEVAADEALHGLFSQAQSWLYTKLGWDFNPQQQTVKYRQKIKADYSAQNGKLTKLTREKGEIETRLNTDFGPENAFLPLIDKCFEANVEKYVYEMCPFNSAAQKDGGMSTSLGSWGGFENDYKTLVFSNGQHCWSGPNRNLKVDLECGSKEELSHVEEPSRCEYHAKMTTPAACSQEEAAKVQEAVAAAEKELTEKDEL